MNSAFFYLLALGAGTMLPIQAAINGHLAKFAGNSIYAAALSAIVSAVGLVGTAIIAGRAGPQTLSLSSAPWWAWVGGLCGVVFLSAATATAPRLGTANMMALVLTGQVLTALAIDRMGWFGIEAQSISAVRLVAALLLVAGAVLMSVKL